MKALLMDVCVILLILVGTAGADAPAYLANAVEAASGDTDQPSPKYTPIPEARKNPSQASSTEAAQPFGNLRSEFIPAGTTRKPSAKLVAAPLANTAPTYEYAPAVGTGEIQGTTDPVATPPGEIADWNVAVPATPAPVLPPAAIMTTPEPGYAYQPLVPVVSTPKTIHLGRGIFGQPTVYVPGQPVRNFLRYFSP